MYWFIHSLSFTHCNYAKAIICNYAQQCYRTVFLRNRNSSRSCEGRPLLFLSFSNRSHANTSDPVCSPLLSNVMFYCLVLRRCSPLVRSPRIKAPGSYAAQIYCTYKLEKRENRPPRWFQISHGNVRFNCAIKLCQGPWSKVIYLKNRNISLHTGCPEFKCQNFGSM